MSKKKIRAAVRDIVSFSINKGHIEKGRSSVMSESAWEGTVLHNEFQSEMKEKYGVKEIGIFGSFVRGEAREDSDVDILVEFEKPIGFFKFLELEEYLSNLIGRKVDLVSKKALKPHIGKYILEEVVTV